jgi:hypothetical protein
VFADVANDKIDAPATADELAMVPPDLKSRISLASFEALLFCVEQLQLLVRPAYVGSLTHSALPSHTFRSMG